MTIISIKELVLSKPSQPSSPASSSASSPTTRLTPSLLPPPSLWLIFSTWLVMGIQSFGGGSSTFYLIHQACIDRGWLSEEEFVRTWALAQISPGINLVKLTVLVGNRLRGWPGLLAASAGLLLPSAGVTVLMTAGFSAIRGQPLVQAAMKGILPATIGLSLAMAAHLLILAASALLLAIWNVSPVLVLLLSGTAAIVLLALLPIPSLPGKDGAR